MPSLKCFKLLSAVLLALTLAFGAWLRYPRIGEGLPFFYREDEAHHFNRLVNMVKSGDLNPRYFHKPSLHFYVRIPAVAAGFLWGVREGSMRSIKEVNTKDPFGVADYAFSASHPGIVKWNRGLSVLISLGIVALTFAVTLTLTTSASAALTAAFLVSISPALVADSAVIGVDIVMAFFCLATTACALLFSRSRSLSLLTYTGLLAGLAISSKYNALPIAVVPLACCMLWAPGSLHAWVIALTMPLAGFLLGSPYILSSLPVFLDQLAYEVWHYGVAVHEGHSAEPGLPQALFYLEWLHSDGLGVVASALGIVGVAVLFLKNHRQNVLFLAFPVLFAGLMIFQRTNFTRNMLVIVPYVAISACAALSLILDGLRARAPARASFFSCFVFIASLLPLQQTFEERARSETVTDSRLAAEDWLRTHADKQESTAIAGQLQFPLSVYRIPGVSRVNLNDVNLFDLWQHGFDRLIAPKGFQVPQEHAGLITLERAFPGTKQDLRIVQDPPMSAYRFVEESVARLHFASLSGGLKPAPISFKQRSDSSIELTCLNQNSGEKHCWLTHRLSVIKLEPWSPTPEILTLALKVQSPWQQEVVFSAGSWQQKISLAPGVWQDILLSPPAMQLSANQNLISVYSPHVHSPKERGINEDSRRLAVAFLINEEGLPK